MISIHALREESDQPLNFLHWPQIQQFQSTLSVRRATLQKSRLDNLLFDFNPRSPWGERLCWAISKSITSLFQSTLSVRRATQSSYCYWRPKSHFNPRSPWGERRNRAIATGVRRAISIHALREESDPRKGRTLLLSHRISIHALREESDVSASVQSLARRLISIHALREESDGKSDDIKSKRHKISIHALREESDAFTALDVTTHNQFQSTLSVRRATLNFKMVSHHW